MVGMEDPEGGVPDGAQVSLQSVPHRKMLTTGPDGRVRADSEDAQSWEFYRIAYDGPRSDVGSISSGDIVTLGSVHETFVGVAPDGLRSARSA